MTYLRKAWHIVAAGRLYFLAGGVVMYAFGAANAWYEKRQLAMTPLVTGLCIVLLVQVMTNYINEYWDSDDDGRVALRTPFSGGSGVVASGAISARTLYVVAVVCASLAALLTLSLWLAGQLPALSLAAIVLATCGGIAYSQPPLRLAARGLGEVTAAVIVCFLTPLVAYSLQTKTVSLHMVLACLPAMVMQFAMLLAIEFPDYDADLVTGKRNLVVRLGLEHAVRLYAVVVASAFVVVALIIVWGMPVWTAMLLVAVAPVAVLQVWLVHKVSKGDVAKTPWMAFLGVALFFAFASVQIVGYIL